MSNAIIGTVTKKFSCISMMEGVDLLDFELTFCNSSMKQMRSSN